VKGEDHWREARRWRFGRFLTRGGCFGLPLVDVMDVDGLEGVSVLPDEEVGRWPVGAGEGVDLFRHGDVVDGLQLLLLWGW
jgi:hypothetical protein